MLKLGRSATKIGTNVWSMEKGATPWATTGNTMEKGATPLVESNTFQVVSYILYYRDINDCETDDRDL